MKNDSQNRDVGLQRVHHQGQQRFHICISAWRGSSTSILPQTLTRGWSLPPTE